MPRAPPSRSPRLSGSGLGNAFAGGAAVAEDASTVWSNPAGMVRIPTMQAARRLHIVTPSIKFNNNGSIAALNQPLGDDGGDAGTHNYVPNMYFSRRSPRSSSSGSASTRRSASSPGTATAGSGATRGSSPT